MLKQCVRTKTLCALFLTHKLVFIKEEKVVKMHTSRNLQTSVHTLLAEIAAGDVIGRD